MAAIFIVAGLAIADKVEKKKEAKRQKKRLDDARYAELQTETNQRLARTQSGTLIDLSTGEEAEVEEERDESGQEPPEYEEVEGLGKTEERKEKGKRRWSVLGRREKEKAKGSVDGGQGGAEGVVAGENGHMRWG